MMKRKWRRTLSVVLSLAMLFGMTGTNTAFAAQDGAAVDASDLCEHHESHTADCGYTERMPDAPCTHKVNGGEADREGPLGGEHTDECSKEAAKCVHEHTGDCYEHTEDIATDSNAQEPVNCEHICDEASGCITTEPDCPHSHDEDCGYAAAVPGTACLFECEECAALALRTEAKAEGDIEINNTNFPDDHFRAYLLAQNYGTDGTLTAAEIAGITAINVASKNIDTLDGIEHFTALTTLQCNNNKLSGTLDVSALNKLNTFHCNQNNLTAIVLSADAPYGVIHVNNNFLADQNAVTGKTIDWDSHEAGTQRFFPQKTLPATPITTALELINALQSTTSATISMTEDITLTGSSSLLMVKMEASHTLNIAEGKTLTMGGGTGNHDAAMININGHTLTVTGGNGSTKGKVLINNYGSNGIYAYTGTLNLEHVEVEVTNSIQSGLGNIQTLNVKDGATVTLNGDGSQLLRLDDGQTTTVESGGTIMIMKHGASGISMLGGDALHIDGGAVHVNSSSGIGIWTGIGSTLKLSNNGTLDGTGTIGLYNGCKVEGLTGKFTDRETAFTASGEVTAGLPFASPDPNGLTGGDYTWSAGSGTFSKPGYNVSGTVKDSGSHGISGASVTLEYRLDEMANEVGTAITDADGAYTFSNISASSYRMSGGVKDYSENYSIKASKDGYETATSDDFSVAGNDVTGKDMTLNGVTAGKLYDITFDPNGGTLPPGLHGPLGNFLQTDSTTGKLLALPPATRSSHRFNGWFTEVSGGTQITLNTEFTQNTTIYAHWTYTGDSAANAITVTGGTASPATAAQGTIVTLTANTAPGGQRFKEWTISPSVTFTDGTSKTSETAKFTMPGQAVTATAVYENMPTTVTGVSVSPATATVQKGTTRQFGVSVTGTGAFASTVTWSVAGGGAGTSINPSGVLTVAQGETADTLTVTAASTVDNTKKGTATVTVTDKPVMKYLVTVNGGTGGAEHEAGDTVTITATVPAGKQFKNWSVDSGGVTLANANSESTTFTMPNNAVTVTANLEDAHSHSYTGAWKHSSSQHWQLCTCGDKGNIASHSGNPCTVCRYLSGGSSGGGDDGGESTPSTPPITTPDKPDAPTDARTDVKASVDASGKASVHVPEKSVTDAIKAAQDAARKNGTGQNGISVTINVTTDKAASSMAVNLPVNAIKALTDAKVTELRIVSSAGEIRLDLATLKAIEAAGDNITISMNKVDVSKLSAEAQKAIGNRPVFDLSVMAGGKTVTDFGGGQVSIFMPYTTTANENAGNLFGVYVDGNGRVTYLANSSYDPQAKALRFVTNHFSVFGIGYKAPAAFTDITDHWAKTDIEFVVNRGLMSGTGNATFAPDDPMTRGMFATALGRLAGVDTNSYQTSRFADVKADASYAPYVNWAAEKGIVSGTGNTTFAPDQSVTRQEMAVIMANYAKAQDYTVPKTRAAVTFADNGSIASWAAPAVKQMQMAGILNGKDANRFDPAGTVTRGEISAMLRRYVELVIDPATAQGWTQNDAGQWLYYENGKSATGWKLVDGKWYYLYADGSMAVNTKIDGYEVGADGARSR